MRIGCKNIIMVAMSYCTRCMRCFRRISLKSIPLPFIADPHFFSFIKYFIIIIIIIVAICCLDFIGDSFMFVHMQHVIVSAV